MRVPELGNSTEPTPALPAPTPRRLEIVQYVVSPGDTLRSIAEKFGVSTEVLVWSNDLVVPDLLNVGQQVLVPPAATLVHRVMPGDTVRSLAATYSTETRKIAEVNALAAPDLISVGQRLLIPGRVPPRPVPVEELQRTAPGQLSPAELAESPPREQDQLVAASLNRGPVQVDEPPPASAPRTATAPQPPPRSPQEAFIRSIAPSARQSQQATGVPTSVTIAQAILESYWGTSGLARGANNYFGIKAKEKPGTAGVMWIDTPEVMNGRTVSGREPFRAYASAADSFTDHGRFFLENARYTAAMAARADPRQFAREIHRAGYATDPGYAAKLIGLMNQYDLYRFDQ